MANKVDSNIGSLPKTTYLADDSLLVAEQQGEAVAVTGELFKQFARDSVTGYVGSADEHAKAAGNSAKSAAQSAEDASKSASNSNTYARNAAASAKAIEDMSVEGVSVSHENSASVEKKVSGGSVKLIFSIPEGKDGVSGVHFGSDEPPENANIWINPNGKPTGTEDWEFDLDTGETDTKTVVVLGADNANGQLAALRFKHNGEWVEIPAIAGEKGDPGYTPQKNIDYFDGADGKDGKDGVDGYTPQKGVDYFDGKDGVDGKDGKDGESGVYVGSGTPPEDATVWVDPSGNPSNTELWKFTLNDGTTVSKSVVVVG